MKIRTFTAGTMKEALVKVRRELGPRAVILHTRACRQGGFLGWGGRQVVEVTATIKRNAIPTRDRAATSEVAGALLARTRVQTPRPRPAGDPSSDTQITTELGAIKAMVEDLVRAEHKSALPDIPEELFQTYTNLIEQEVNEGVARELVVGLRDQVGPEQWACPDVVAEHLRTELEALLDVSDPIRQGKDRARMVALVGPTGVGKTTTIAKLAANFKLRDGLNVGLITVDTYRIAAVEQLRTYADIISLPLRVVLTPRELGDAVREMRDLDIVLIDTAGRSPCDDLKINELRRLLSAADPDEVHLVLSLTANTSHLDAAVTKFSVLGVDRLILTKLDEAMHYGLMLRVLRQVDRPLSYVTTGQDVPDDIEPARRRRLARLILHEESVS